MAKLHELLAAQKTRNTSWNQMYEDTLDKFKKADHYFAGHTRRLRMLTENEGNAAIEAGEREDRPVITTVQETLKDALEAFVNAEDVQFQKNKAKQIATGSVMFRGERLLPDLPMDEMLGLESRLTKLRDLWEKIPTQDATRVWKPMPQIGIGVYEAEPEETAKTDKQVVPIILHEATKEHPANVQAIGKDVPVGRFITTKRTGAATALQKFEALKLIDELIVEIKSARQRANQTEAPEGKVGQTLVDLLLKPFI